MKGESVVQECLTRREYEVAKLVAKGKTNRQVASHLLISERTVRTHLCSVFKSLGIKNRTELSLLFRDNACIEINVIAPRQKHWSDIAGPAGDCGIEPMPLSIVMQFGALTAAEIRTLKFVASGMKNDGIAEAAAVSVSTVRHNLSSIYSKLGVRNRTQAILYALRAKWITLEEITEWWCS